MDVSAWSDDQIREDLFFARLELDGVEKLHKHILTQMHVLVNELLRRKAYRGVVVQADRSLACEATDSGSSPDDPAPTKETT